MSLPVTFHLFGLALHPHFIFELLSYSIGFQFYLYLKRRQTDAIEQEQRLWVIVGAIMGAAIGSKLLGLLEHPNLLDFSKQNLVYLLASKTIVGGLMGGTIGVELIKQLLKIRHSTGDLFTYPLLLGMMIGRVGCFLTGASDGTWGNPTDIVFAVDAGDGILRHPTPLYEIAYLACLWMMIAWIKRRVTLRSGDVFKLFMTGYLGWRFAVEFIKPVTVIAPLELSAIQLACLMGLIYYATLFIRRQKHIGAA